MGGRGGKKVRVKSKQPKGKQQRGKKQKQAVARKTGQEPTKASSLAQTAHSWAGHVRG